MLMGLGIIVMMFTSCGTLTPQETQQERLRLLEAYDEARQRHNPEKVKEAVKDLLIGKWQYVGLEVEEDNGIAQRAESVSQQMSSTVDETPENATTERIKPPDSLEQTEVPDLPNPETDIQASGENTTRLPRIEVTDEKSEQQILAAKAALVASTRQNLTLEFFEDRSSYYYSSNNGGKSATGQCYITTKRYGDDPFPFISFNRRTGPEMVEFIFGSEPVKWRTAKERERKIAMRRNITPISGAKRNRRLTSPPVQPVRRQETSILMSGITVTEDRLYLVLYGKVELTPNGWVRMGGLRCTFRRIE
ncbi:MAG: hypothetical protein OXU36_15805 [Candidatus Poribacteria bacterium]|nr:hypothetical protein [Candidatus Poribacteria bacterium]